MSAAHVDAELTTGCVGAIEAQRIIDGIADGRYTPDHAWLMFVELAARHQWKSAACRSYVLELAKRASAA